MKRTPVRGCDDGRCTDLSGAGGSAALFVGSQDLRVSKKPKPMQSIPLPDAQRSGFVCQHATIYASTACQTLRSCLQDDGAAGDVNEDINGATDNHDGGVESTPAAVPRSVTPARALSSGGGFTPRRSQAGAMTPRRLGLSGDAQRVRGISLLATLSPALTATTNLTLTNPHLASYLYPDPWSLPAAATVAAICCAEGSLPVVLLVALGFNDDLLHGPEAHHTQYIC